MKLPLAWRYWILGWLFLAFLGIQVIESTHHHESAAEEDACAVCVVAAHVPFNLTPPAAAPLAAALFLLFVLPHRQLAFRFAKARCAFYDSQAPPTHTA